MHNAQELQNQNVSKNTLVSEHNSGSKQIQNETQSEKQNDNVHFSHSGRHNIRVQPSTFLFP